MEDKMDKIEKIRLVSRLRGFEQEAKSLRIKIKKAEDKERPSWRLRQAKQVIGVDARHHLLAYAFLRGIPYKCLEPKCRDKNEPNVEMIISVAATFSPNSITDDKIRNWLEGKEIWAKRETTNREEKIEQYITTKTNTIFDKLKILVGGK